ncbi:Transcriptional regulator, LysR family [Sinorhizobium alkalisoli]|nr:Transcriptional regulator, LysR family [Sinorhizobium alkalisoli]
MSAAGETDLARLLAQMNPILRENEYVYCSVQGDVERWIPLEPIGTFREAEGVTLILERSRAEAARLPYGPVLRLITLGVHSALEAVGLTAAVSAAARAPRHQRQYRRRVLPRPHLRAGCGCSAGPGSIAGAVARLRLAQSRWNSPTHGLAFPAPAGLNRFMAFTLRQLQYFVAVAEQGSVTRAAQNLSISQSSITEAIKELEGDLGVELFDRHPRGLSVTHNGHQFLRHATKILADVSDARRSFSDSREERGGKLNLGVTSLVAGYVLSDLLARYRRACPGVEVSALEDNGSYLEHLLIGGELDVAVMVISNLRDRMALQAEILETSPYRLWLPIGHPLVSADIISVGDIAREPLIMLTVDEIEENTGKLLTALGARPHVAFRTRSVEAVRSLVATGAGIALLPDLIYRPWSLEGDRIESRDVSGALPVVQVGMVWRKGSSLPHSARDFVGIAEAMRSARPR